MKYYIIAVLLSFAALVEGQVKQGSLQVGSQFPVMKPIKLLNGDWVDLQTSQSKIIILEFFDTYCTTCIASMPKLKELQGSMGDSVAIYMVTYQDKNLIEKFYKNNKFLQEKKAILPTIIADTVLHQMFPRKSVPHSVWIYKGRVQAITYADYVKRSYLVDLFKNQQVDVPVKDDFKILPELGKDVANIENKEALGYVHLTGYDSTLTQKAGLNLDRDSLSNIIAYFNNMDVLGAFTSLWSKIKKPSYLLLPQRIVWNVRDSSRYFYNESSDDSYQEWIRKNGISYKRSQLVNLDDKKWAQLIINDLNTMLGLQVGWTNKQMPCLVLKRTGKNVPAPIKNEGKYQKIKSTDVLVFLLDYSGKYPPAVDEVREKIDLELPEYKDLDELNAFLINYRLEVVKENRSIEVLEFKELK